ncbi:MAG: polymer-forming cytoskeletal protein [bacterium]|nr:polymer-forming cytoskeletal protein [Gemmatimonadota bacterium]
MFNKRNPDTDQNPQQPVSETPSTSSSYTPVSTPTASTSAGGSAATVLAEGCTFEGTANVDGTFRIEGKVNGEIQASDGLVVAKSGEVEAQAKVRRAIVNGRFQGKIHATDKVELQSGGRVDAEIRAKNMVMEDGVRFEGHCQIGS